MIVNDHKWLWTLKKILLFYKDLSFNYGCRIRLKLHYYSIIYYCSTIWIINEKVSRLLFTIIYYWFTVLVTIRFLKKNPETNEEIKTHTLHIRYQVFHRLLGITLCKSSYHQQKQRGCVTKKWLFPHPQHNRIWGVFAFVGST